MPDINRAVKGTNDVLPAESYKWQFVEEKMLDAAARFGFKEIRVPVFEHTEVFTRSVGDTTDVVQKEMYTFEDKGGRSVTLRPELTAGTVRSAIEHGLINEALPVKMCYIGGCYRYEKPQAGRLREFHQFGVECLGAAAPSADAEIILLADTLLRELGITDLWLEINSIGCPECRKVYQTALKEYFNQHIDELCDTCKDRMERNPMRILDCKSPVCSKIADKAPCMIDYLCDECREHFDSVKEHLAAAGIKFTVNPHIVRGLDYYTKTVFEFVSGSLGAQSTVCGGGRYDELVSQMGGPHLPSLGFGMGIERLLMIMQAENCVFKPADQIDIYIAPIGKAAALKATEICTAIRAEGFKAVTDVVGRGIKAQMKYADKIGAKYCVVIGDDELEANLCRIKDMQSGKTVETSINEGIVNALYSFDIEKTFDNLTESLNTSLNDMNLD